MDRARAVLERLRQRRQSVVTAESCTGGLLAALLSCAEGAGDCLHGGFVVYSKEQKALALGVSRSLLRRGSVSAAVAQQLAQGALERSTATLALGVTGVVGPNPDQDGAPPGQVFFALARRGQGTRVIEHHFRGDDPDQVRRAIIVHALSMLGEPMGSGTGARCPSDASTGG